MVFFVMLKEQRSAQLTLPGVVIQYKLLLWDLTIVLLCMQQGHIFYKHCVFWPSNSTYLHKRWGLTWSLILGIIKKKESKVAQNVFSQKTYSTKYFTTIWSFHESTNENENIPLAFQILVFDNATISIYFIQNCIIKL